MRAGETRLVDPRGDGLTLTRAARRTLTRAARDLSRRQPRLRWQEEVAVQRRGLIRAGGRRRGLQRERCRREITAITSPCDTREPRCTLSSWTTPAVVDGTSIVAFSVSSVISVPSTAMASPALTATSITSTSL